MPILDTIKNFFTEYGDLATGAGALGLLYSAYDQLGDTGSDARSAADALAQLQMGQTQFQPYTITGAQGGTFGAGPDGQFRMNLSPEQMAMSQNLFGQAGGFLDAWLTKSVWRHRVA